MGKYILTAPVLAVAAAASPAQAQDVDWTGFYVGVHGALLSPDSDWDGTSIFQTVDGGEGSFTVHQQSVAINESFSGTELGGGGRVGFNWQTGSLVLGAEADATFFSFTKTMTRTAPGTTYTARTHASDVETLRARVGLPVGQALLFATGGIAFSNLSHNLTATNTSQIVIDGGEGSDTVGTTTASFNTSADTGTGLVFGAGGELAVTDNISVSLTGLFLDFGSETMSASNAPASIAATVDSSMFIGTLGVNLRF